MNTATLHLTHSHMHIHIAKKAKKEKKSPVSLQNHSLAAVATYSCLFWKPNCDLQSFLNHPPSPQLSGALLHNEEALLHFSTAYCEPGRSPLLISEQGRKQMQCFWGFFKKKKILTCDYDKQKTRTLLIHKIVSKKEWNWREKSEGRSKRGTSSDIFCAFKHVFLHWGEIIPLLRLLLEHRQNTNWMVITVLETVPGSNRNSPFKCFLSTSAANLTFKKICLVNIHKYVCS